ncbi:uncharacterized protein AMSG_04554 [Thecamonas trahens ATCC 50062]|uniref:Uncharacterized protein n=1 Tax=Thecamonas trahens ATCC 50062 TaxID=461836 RepID=A0A0L0DAK0_THETB|nr:hypothetical protein AMSG_04554 [Thecamonas trahens ATCC 50062]KNC48323.1 hypothetical protein AMSG_04554 [Thecamonas trahens ATCC 50062]|eukprot:XP_013758890.1 hypothetical protein AMSG_04554 [Thecamonas trahens ATCC 50062]
MTPRGIDGTSSSDSGALSPMWRVDAQTLNFCGVAAAEVPGEDGRVVLVASGDDPGGIVVYEAEMASARCELVRVMIPADNMGMCMAVRLVFAASVPLAVAGYESGALAVWDAAAGSLLATTNAAPWFGDPVMALDVVSVDRSSEEWTLRGVAGSATAEAVAFRIDSSSGGEAAFELVKKRAVADAGEQGVSSVAIRAADGKLVALGGWEGSLSVHSAKKLKPLAVLEYHAQRVSALGFDADPDGGGYLVSGSPDGRIAVWDLYPVAQS